MYLIGRILFGRNVGFAAALLFQVLPVPARVTSDGLSEGVYLLAVAVAILLGVRAVRGRGSAASSFAGWRPGRAISSGPKGCWSALEWER